MKKIILILLIGLFYLGNVCFAVEMAPAEIMEKYGKAVVLIATVKNNEEMGLGSGFIVKSDGVVVTNYHVIDGAYPVFVKLINGDVYEDISIIGYDQREDFAILKIKGFDLPTVMLGNSNNVRVGERLVVIGNPQGLENTITDGLLSQLRDSGLGYKLHQISTPISHGSSGSPVFNSNGEVIGIATLSIVEGQNLNFSVPINYARGLINDPVKCTLKEFTGIKAEKVIPTAQPLLDNNIIVVMDFENWPNNLGGETGVYGALEPNWNKIKTVPYSWIYEPIAPGYNLANVHSGKNSFRLVNGLGIKPNYKWGSFALDLGPTINLNTVPKKVRSLNVYGYKYLSFWAKGAKGGENIVVLFRDAHALNYQPQVSYKVLSATQEWQEIKVPLIDIANQVDLQQLDNIGLAFGKDMGNEKGATIYIDDFCFTK